MPITLTLRSVKGSRLTIAEMDGNLTALRDAIEAIDWAALSGKPLLFPPASHTHAIEQRDREQFAAICQQEQQKNPALRCVWVPRGTE